MSLGPSYVIQDVPGKGRALFASRPIAAGETILIERPALLVVPLACASTVCATCTKFVTSARHICGACGGAVFCSPECEAVGRADPGVHSPAICAAYTSIAGAAAAGLLPRYEDAIDTCRFFAHALALRDAAAALNDGSETCKRWAALASCCGGSTEDDAPSSLIQGFMTAVGMAEDPWRLLEALARKDEMNTFALLHPPQPGDEERRVRAYALYDECSAMNHDCMPNAARCDPVHGHVTGDNRMIICALQAIAPGQEVSIAYTPLDWAYEDRAEFLRDHYGFACACERCWAERHMLEKEAAATSSAMTQLAAPVADPIHPSGHSLAELETYLDLFFVRYVCQTEDCGGTLVPRSAAPTAPCSCNVCGASRSHEEFLEALREMQQA